jgi:hypothetical protein
MVAQRARAAISPGTDADRSAPTLAAGGER